MKITHLNSATELIEVNGLKILTDPWLVDGVFLGTWHIYPPYDWKTRDLSDVDYIYASHIHPDHFCDATMKKLDPNIPVLIHRYQDDFLKRKVHSLGFQVIELENDQRTPLRNGVHINIIAADNCNPAVCGRAFNCLSYLDSTEKLTGSTQIDSICVIDDGKHVLLNTNDSPYPLLQEALERVMARYPRIDLLLVGYGAASMYPFVMTDYTHEQKLAAARRVRGECLQRGIDILSRVKPRFFMPFAGTFVIGGSKWKLNAYSPLPELQDAAREMHESQVTQGNTGTHPILLNPGESFDLESETASAPYRPVDSKDRDRYIETVLSHRKYDYEEDPLPTFDDFRKVIPRAVDRFYTKARTLQFSTSTKIYVQIVPGQILALSLDGTGHWEIIETKETAFPEPFIYFSLDPRLLLRSLRGPRYTHWNTIENTPLMQVTRRPDVYEMGLHMSLSYLHE